MKFAFSARRASPLVAFVAGGSAILFTGMAEAADVTVKIDETQILTLDHPVATLSVGNPSIAGVTVQDGKTLFLLGRSFGNTNLVALDANGQTIFETKIFVTGHAANFVTLNKGSLQTSYACAPRCERSLMLGDNKQPDFDDLYDETSKKTGLSVDAAKQ